MAADLDATHKSDDAVEQMRQLASSAIASGQPLSWYETVPAKQGEKPAAARPGPRRR